MLLKLKITLNYIEPKIWRRVLIEGDRPLEDLHWVIQNIFDWEFDHIASFKQKDEWYELPSPADYYNYDISSIEEDDDDEEEEYEELLIKHLISKHKDKLTYIYDFGDHWEHLIVVESLGKKDYSGMPEPLVLDGQRSGPIENSGGPFGYMHLLEAMADKDHPNRDEILEWLGGDDFEHDPEYFDVEEQNAGLREAFKLE